VATVALHHFFISFNHFFLPWSLCLVWWFMTSAHDIYTSGPLSQVRWRGLVNPHAYGFSFEVKPIFWSLIVCCEQKGERNTPDNHMNHSPPLNSQESKLFGNRKMLFRLSSSSSWSRGRKPVGVQRTFYHLWPVSICFVLGLFWLGNICLSDTHLWYCQSFALSFTCWSFLGGNALWILSAK